MIINDFVKEVLTNASRYDPLKDEGRERVREEGMERWRMEEGEGARDRELNGE